MAIIAWPDDVQINDTAQCAICGRTMSLMDLTAGLWTANSTQAFACNGHFWNESQLMIGWSRFRAEQRRILDRAASKSTYGGADYEQSLR